MRDSKIPIIEANPSSPPDEGNEDRDDGQHQQDVDEVTN